MAVVKTEDEMLKSTKKAAGNTAASTDSTAAKKTSTGGADIKTSGGTAVATPIDEPVASNDGTSAAVQAITLAASKKKAAANATTGGEDVKASGGTAVATPIDEPVASNDGTSAAVQAITLASSNKKTAANTTAEVKGIKANGGTAVATPIDDVNYTPTGSFSDEYLKAENDLRAQMDAANATLSADEDDYYISKIKYLNAQRDLNKAYYNAVESARNYESNPTTENEQTYLYYKKIYDELSGQKTASFVNYKNAAEIYNEQVSITNAANQRYNDYVNGELALFNERKDNMRSYSEITADLDSVNAEIAELEKERGQTQAEADLYRYEHYDNENMGLNINEITQKLATEQLEYENKINLLKKQQKELEEEQKFFFDAAMTSSDFAEKSVYVSQMTGTYKYNNTTGYSGYSNDPTYDRVNRNAEAMKYANANESKTNAEGVSLYTLGADESWQEYLTDDEIAIYNYYYNSGDKDRANDYLQTLKSTLVSRQQQYTIDEFRKYAEKHSVAATIAGSIYTVTAAPLKTADYISAVIDLVTEGEVGDNTLRTTKHIDSIRQVNAESVGEWFGNLRKTAEGKENWANAGEFLYNTTMSILDFKYNNAIANGFADAGSKLAETVSLGMMGVEAAASATSEALERGLSDGKAVALGAFAGAAEIITEKVSVEALFNENWDNGLKYFLKNTFSEGSEEVGSDIINLVADVLIAGDKSDFRTKVNELVASGEYTTDQAFTQVLWDEVKQMGLDFLGGAISGGVMAGEALALNKYVNKENYKTLGEFINRLGDDVIDSYIEMGKASANTEVQQKAQALQAKLENHQALTNEEIGELAAGVMYGENTSTTVNTTETPTVNANAQTENVTAETLNEQVQQQAQENSANINTDTAQNVTDDKSQRIANARDELERTAIENDVDEIEYNRVRRVADALKANVRYFSEDAYQGADGSQYINDGYYDANEGVIYVNAKSEKAVVKIISHELTHRLEGSNEYADFTTWAKAYMGEAEYASRVKEVSGNYDATGKNYNAEHEVMARFVEDTLLKDENAVYSLINHKRSLANRVLDWMKHAVAKLKKRGANAQETATLDRGIELFQKMLAETQTQENTSAQNTSETAKNKTTEEDHKLSLPGGENVASDNAKTSDNEDGKLKLPGGTENERTAESKTEQRNNDDRSTERNSGDGEQGQGGRVGEVRPQRTTYSNRAQIERQNNAKSHKLQKVSTASLEIEHGTDSASLIVYPKELWDDELKGVSYGIEQTTGREVVFVLGSPEVNYGGKNERVRYIEDGNYIYIQADHMSVTPTQIGERITYLNDLTGDLEAQAEKALRDTYSDDVIDMLLARYITAMRGQLGIDENSSAKELESAFKAVTRELLADAYAGINNYALGANKMQSTVRDAKRGVQYSVSKTRDSVLRARADVMERMAEEIDNRVNVFGQDYGYLGTAGTTNKNDKSGFDKVTEAIYALADFDSEETFKERWKSYKRALDNWAYNVNNVNILMQYDNIIGSAVTAMYTQNEAEFAKTLEKVEPYFAKKDLKRDLINMFSIPDGMKKDVGNIIEKYANEMIAQGSLSQELRNELFNELYNRGIITIAADEYYKQGRETALGKQIYVDPSTKADFGDDWNDFRKRAFAAGVILTLDASKRTLLQDEQRVTTIKTISDEIAGSFYGDELGGMFDEDEGRAALEWIVHIAEEGKDSKITLAEYVDSIANEDHISSEEFISNLENQIDRKLEDFADRARLESYFRNRGINRATEEAYHHQKSEAAEKARHIQAEANEKTRHLDIEKRQLERHKNVEERQRQEHFDIEKRQRERHANAEERQKQEHFDIEKRQREKQKLAWARAAERRRQQRQEQRERRDLHNLQEATRKNIEWLVKNRNKAPKDMKEHWDAAIEGIDYMAVSHVDKSHLAEWVSEITRYEWAKQNDPNWMPSKRLEDIKKRLDYKKLADYDIGQLQLLYQTVSQIRQEYYNRNNLLNANKQDLLYDIHDEIKNELAKAPDIDSSFFKTGASDSTNYSTKDKAKRAIKGFLNAEQLSPANMLQMMGGWNPNGQFAKMARMLEDGEREQNNYRVRAISTLKDFYENNKEWIKNCDGQGKDGMWYEMEVPPLLEYRNGDQAVFGNPIKVYFTPAQKVHMYLESKNYSNLNHMIGGRTFVNKELYQKGDKDNAFSKGTTIRLAPGTVRQIVSHLTTEEKQLADLLEKYYNGMSKQAINRVSMILEGYDKAPVENYAPIVTNKGYTNTEFGIFDMSAEGQTNLKSRVWSLTPSYNISALEAFERNVKQTSRYVGMAIPIRDVTAIFNATGTSDNQKVKGMITEKYGTEAWNYIERVMNDLQSYSVDDKSTISGMMDKVFGMGIRSTFAANLSIMAKQIGSYWMAMPYLGTKNMPSFKNTFKAADYDLINTYTQQLEYRSMGYTTPEVAKYATKAEWQQKNKYIGFAFGGDQLIWMDKWTASRLWQWAENKVRNEYPTVEIGTEEKIKNGESQFYQMVAQEFDNAVGKSQSTTDYMHNGMIRRSTNPIDKAFTMFKSDASQAYNELRQFRGEYEYYKRVNESIDEGKDEESKNKKAKAVANMENAKKRIGTAAVGIFASNFWATLITALNDALKYKLKHYRNDDDELTLGSVLKELGIDLSTSLAGIVVGGEELAEIISNVITGDRWYGIDIAGLDDTEDLIEDTMSLATGLAGDVASMLNIIKNHGSIGDYLKKNSHNIMSAIHDGAVAISNLSFGFPIKNLETYTLGILSYFVPALTTGYNNMFAKVTKETLSGLHGKALTQTVKDLLNLRTEDGVTKDTAKELARLYTAGYEDAIPTQTGYTFTVDGESIKLDAYHQQIYDRVWRETIGTELDKLVSSAEYINADDELKSKMIKALYDCAGNFAKAEATDTSNDDYTARKVAKTGNLADYAIWKGLKSTTSTDKEMYALLLDSDFSDEVKATITAGELDGDWTREDQDGKVTQYGKFVALTDGGMSIDKYLEIKSEYGTDAVSAIYDGYTNKDSDIGKMTLDEYADIYCQIKYKDGERVDTNLASINLLKYADDNKLSNAQVTALTYALNESGKLADEASLYSNLRDKGLSAAKAYEMAVDLLTPGTSNELQLQYIEDSGYKDKDLTNAVGAVLGFELETESGNATNYAKFLQAIDAGMSAGDALMLYNDGVSASDLTHYAGSGLSTDDIMKVEAAEADAEDVVKYHNEYGLQLDTAIAVDRALVDLEDSKARTKVAAVWEETAGLDAEDRVRAIGAALGGDKDNSMYEKTAIAEYMGVDLDNFVGVYELMPEYDANGNGSYTQAEVQEAIEAYYADKLPTGNTQREKAIIWQLLGSVSWKKNPYSTVYNAIHELYANYDADGILELPS